MSSIITAGDASVGPIITPGSNGVLTLQSGLAGNKVNALTFAADGTPTFLRGPVASMVRVSGGNGYGSTNTAIFRFTTVNASQGADITYASSATLGDSFTINTAGVYAMTCVAGFTGIAWAGISLDSIQLSTATPFITAVSRLAAAYSSTAGGAACVAATVFLPAGSVVRGHGEVNGPPMSGVSQFTITRVA
jgi:hypothetical protein